MCARDLMTLMKEIHLGMGHTDESTEQTQYLTAIANKQEIQLLSNCAVVIIVSDAIKTALTCVNSVLHQS